MASYYVWSGASAGGNGTTWVLAYQTLTLALSGKVAGDIFYLAHDHAESTAAALTLGGNGTAGNPIQVLCVNRAGSVPPVSADLRTTATVTTTGAFNIALSGSVYYYGVTFQVGTGATAASFSCLTASGVVNMVNCKIRLLTTATTSTITLQASQGFLQWTNVVVEVSNVSQTIAGAGFFIWRNTPSAIAGATIPTYIMNTTGAFIAQFEGVDFSAVASGKNVVFANGPSSSALTLKDCKLGTGVTISAAPLGPNRVNTDVINCDSGDTNTRFERYRFEATETTETTIVRTGGASDGTTTTSRKIVTTSNAKWVRPYEAMPLAVWNEVVGSAITLTVECISSAVLNNDDIWIDIEYLGTSGFPLGVYATTGKADILTTGTANTTSTETWGGALTGKFKLVKAITPLKKGWIYVYPKVAKASTTVYVDPEITVT